MKRWIVYLFLPFVIVMAEANDEAGLSAKAAKSIIKDWFPEGRFGGTAPNGNRCEILINQNVNGEANSINFTVAELREGKNYHDELVLADAIDKAHFILLTNDLQNLDIKAAFKKNKSRLVHLTIAKLAMGDQYAVILNVKYLFNKTFSATCISSPKNLIGVVQN